MAPTLVHAMSSRQVPIQIVNDSAVTKVVSGKVVIAVAERPSNVVSSGGLKKLPSFKLQTANVKETVMSGAKCKNASPTCNVIIGDIPVSVLVDTGADTTLIDQRILKRIPNKYIYERNPVNPGF